MTEENKNITQLCQEIDKNIDILFQDLAYYKEKVDFLNKQNNEMKKHKYQILKQLDEHVAELNALKAELKSIIENVNNNA